MRVAAPIVLTPEQKTSTEQCARARSLPARLVERARIVLFGGGRKLDKEIAGELGITAHKVARWRQRYLATGLAGLEKDAPRAGSTPSISAAKVKQVVHKTTAEKPTQATHWSTRTMAAATSLSATTVRRIWRKHGLKPQLVETFKVSTDPHFAEKLESIVGLYLNPREHALVLCCDEKSQIQALDRTQPGLPLKRGRAGTMTHDYKRNGTATLFAALNTLDGKVISLCQERHRHQEWLRFLRLVNDATPEHKQLHLIVDNYATHKHPAVQRWLKRHTRLHIHFTPTSASWLNMVERFFRDLTVKRLRRGVFRDVMELVNTIDDYVDRHNERPKPFIWTASAKDILEKVKRARKALVNAQSV
jgi:transposase